MHSEQNNSGWDCIGSGTVFREMTFHLGFTGINLSCSCMMPLYFRIGSLLQASNKPVIQSFSSSRQCVKKFTQVVKNLQLSSKSQRLPLTGNICIGVISVGSVGAYGLLRGNFHAQCAYKPSKNRLEGLDDQSSQPEQPFPWKKFFALLWPDVWYLVGAVIVSHPW